MTGWHDPGDRLQPLPPTARELLQAMSTDHPNGARLAKTFEQWISNKAPGRPGDPPLAMSPDQLKGWRRYKLQEFVRALNTLGDVGKLMETVR